MNAPDDLDYEILRLLQEDAKRSFREIAKRLKVAEGTVYNRVKALEKEGIILGSHIDVAYGKLGYGMTAIVGMRIRGGHLGEIEGKIAADPNTLAVYDVTGEFDAIVVCKFRNREELNRFVKRINALPHVDRTYTMLALDIPKEVTGIPVSPPRIAVEDVRMK